MLTTWENKHAPGHRTDILCQNLRNREISFCYKYLSYEFLMCYNSYIWLIYHPFGPLPNMSICLRWYCSQKRWLRDRCFLHSSRTSLVKVHPVTNRSNIIRIYKHYLKKWHNIYVSKFDATPVECANDLGSMKTKHVGDLSIIFMYQMLEKKTVLSLAKKYPHNLLINLKILLL